MSDGDGVPGVMLVTGYMRWQFELNITYGGVQHDDYPGRQWDVFGCPMPRVGDYVYVDAAPIKTMEVAEVFHMWPERFPIVRASVNFMDIADYDAQMSAVDAALQAMTETAQREQEAAEREAQGVGEFSVKADAAGGGDEQASEAGVRET